MNLDNIKGLLKLALIGLITIPLLPVLVPLAILAGVGTVVEEVYKDFLK